MEAYKLRNLGGKKPLHVCTHVEILLVSRCLSKKVLGACVIQRPAKTLDAFKLKYKVYDFSL
jgi:hypothetical protein